MSNGASGGVTVERLSLNVVASLKQKSQVSGTESSHICLNQIRTEQEIQ